jgi:hypothetical protein
VTDATRRPGAAGALPEAPRWLNLHALLDEELCAEMADLADEAEALAPAIRDLAIRGYRAMVRFERSTAELEMDWEAPAFEMIRRTSGFVRFADAFDALADHLAAARMDKPDDEPDWVEQERLALGATWPVR